MSAAGRGASRSPQDFYPTPVKAIKAVLDRVDISSVRSSCEPCRGTRVIYDLLPGKRYWAELSEGKNYLTSSLPHVDLIITNPPFSLAIEFLLKSFMHATCVIYLLRLNFLGSRKRNWFFNEYRPSHLYVLSDRLTIGIEYNQAMIKETETANE